MVVLTLSSCRLFGGSGFWRRHPRVVLGVSLPNHFLLGYNENLWLQQKWLVLPVGFGSVQEGCLPLLHFQVVRDTCGSRSQGVGQARYLPFRLLDRIERGRQMSRPVWLTASANQEVSGLYSPSPLDQRTSASLVSPWEIAPWETPFVALTVVCSFALTPLFDVH